MGSPWLKCHSLLQMKTHGRATLLQIHAFMLRNALETNLHLVTKLITNLSSADPRRGSGHARQLFDQMPQKRDAFICNAMMKSHLSSRQFCEAIRLCVCLRRKEGFVPDNYTFTILTRCCSLNFLTREGMEVHAHVLRYGFNSNLYVANALVDMYGKLGQMGFARKVFDEMTERSSASWTVLMTGYIRGGDMGSAKALFDVIPENKKDAAAFNVMINGYMKLGEMKSAKVLFDAMPEKDVVSWTTLIHGYVKLGEVITAKMLFDAMPGKDVVSWTTMIDGYVKLGEMRSAKMLFDAMPEKNVVSWNTMIDGYVKLGDMRSAKMLFDAMPEKDMVSWTTMIDGSVKLGEMKWAKMLFDAMPEKDVVAWTTMIDGYMKLGEMSLAKMLFDAMPEKNVVSWNTMIDGYVKLGEMSLAKMLFDAMPEKDVVSWTTMIHGYCSNGDVDNARWLFDMMPNRNLYSWSAMIGGYCQNKQSHEALLLFQKFLAWKVFEPDDVMVLSVLPAIADLGALDLGNWVYEFVKRKKLDRSANISTALVDMYAKFGEIKKARRVFDDVQARDTCTWNALINGLAFNGCAKEALEVFMEMQEKGFNPDEITMVGVLSACNHGGLVEEGKSWFTRMGEFGLTPKIEHYRCLVDLLGRAGCLKEAERLVQSMPYETDEIILSSLLSACGYANDVTRAEKVVKKAINMELCKDSNYIMLRNLYASGRRWRDVEQIEKLMLTKGAKKKVGCSAIEINS